MERLTLGKMQNPIRGFLHGGAALASLVGLILLVYRAQGNATARLGALVFGTALIVMYTISTLYHSFPWGETWKRRLQRLDHSAIYLVVAGTFTPVAIASLRGATLAVGLILVWAIAVTGIMLKVFLPDVATWLSITLQMVMGWLAIIWIPQILTTLGVAGLTLIALGGASYIAGVVVFTTKRPRLAPRSFSYHELFHVMVILGSLLHYLAVFVYAIPAVG
ncbi:MAG TPA: hemolysin III family protein [Acidimicrobiia bacterium]|nr:hemolysin III family protein [Acidimicrobiia bacterium]